MTWGLFVCSQAGKDIFQEVTVPVEPLSGPPSTAWTPLRLCRSFSPARLALPWPPLGQHETSAWSPDSKDTIILKIQLDNLQSFGYTSDDHLFKGYFYREPLKY